MARGRTIWGGGSVTGHPSGAGCHAVVESPGREQRQPLFRVAVQVGLLTRSRDSILCSPRAHLGGRIGALVQRGTSPQREPICDAGVVSCQPRSRHSGSTRGALRDRPATQSASVERPNAQLAAPRCRSEAGYRDRALCRRCRRRALHHQCGADEIVRFASFAAGRRAAG